MRLLVVGGAGYVGALVLPGLAAEHRVRVLDLRPPDIDCEHLIGDATDPEILDAACIGMDAVLHMAMAPTSPVGGCDPATAVDVHVKSAYLATAAAARAGIPHVVFVSSMSVFADLGRRTLAADETPDALDPYGLTKRLGELACAAEARRTGTALTMLRLAWPTTEEAWPAWQVGLATRATDPRPMTEEGLHLPPASVDDPRPMMRMADGRPMAALAAGDLTAALLAALARPDGVRALPLTGDTAGNCVDLTATRDALDGWWPTHT